MQAADDDELGKVSVRTAHTSIPEVEPMFAKLIIVD